MRSILALRHAKSSWKFADLADHDRPLSKRGKRDAPRMGRLLREEGLLPDLILSSTAVRAVTTADLLVGASGYDGEVRTLPELYLADSRGYLQTILGLDDGYARVLLVGHNPGLENLVRLLGGSAERMPTAALAGFEFPVDHWARVADHLPGRLVGLWRPKELD